MTLSNPELIGIPDHHFSSELGGTGVSIKAGPGAVYPIQSVALASELLDEVNGEYMALSLS